ncbi:helix-turn-helix transcriptional regulator [Sphingomonas sp. J344]|uniref:helix-turn-helix domain-containing protein n=1 Tax=Sphingomonas sp. J344 TaxID=2898434 RepID=UPI00215121CB|nr:helix-turn-helix transcriptional regulator [Sphingomonas sp. J344]MCR5870900.1 helix-turn-helix transcriptional regulator [Sphingomonas sp. J344]
MVRRMQAARGRLGLSYAALGERAGVDASQVSRICRGEYATFSDSVVRICTVLGERLRSGDAEPLPALPAARRTDAAWAKLERSVRSAWDETPAGAERLAKVIAAVGEIGRR